MERKLHQEEPLLRKGCKKGAKREPKENQRVPKGGRRNRKGTHREPKQAKRQPKGEQNATKRFPKIRLGARVDFGCQNESIPHTDLDSFWVNFSTKKSTTNRCKNRCRKT